ncbi:hypothetical protein [Bifidobacterium tibiigranuli]|jgi:hypothetical protein|uniref:hypothetical protein n=1 Tax=Bifidobacterium tibiigranuli TaxID=2172043 RepID=UPI0026EE9D7C|nr:hypothetical protein [Bifidobacterium tibiigranuli]MCI2186250.1 hypothetical protein [Bifidobacterium tibiigranuli]MCI2203924.1 hypothetical protein [Bifidobacterium tibiigranuli]
MDEEAIPRKYAPGRGDENMNARRAEQRRNREKNEANSPTGTEISQLSAKLDALTASLALLTSYLTGQQGYGENNSSYDDGSSQSGNIHDFMFVPYDTKYDASLAFVAPKTGVAQVSLSAWIYLGVNAYGDTAYGVNARAGVAFDLLDVSGSPVAGYPRREDAVQATVETWGTNTANVMGASYANIARIRGMTPGASYTLRTRRCRYGYAHDGDSNVIPMPEHGWWKTTIAYPRASVVLVAGGDDETTDAGNGDES